MVLTIFRFSQSRCIASHNMTFTTKTISYFCVAFTCFACITSVVAQESEKRDNDKPAAEAPASSQPGVAVAAQAKKLSDSNPTVADVDAKLAEVSAASDLGEAVIATSKETLLQTKLALVAANNFVAQTTAFQKDAAAAPDNLVAIKKELENKKVADKPDTSQSLAELKLKYESTESDLNSSRQQLTSQAGETSRRQSRQVEIPGRLTEAEQELVKLNAQIEKIADDADPALVVDVRRMNLQAQRFKLKSEISALEAERKFYAASIELLPLQNESLQRKIERLQNQSAQLKSAVEVKRESEIDKLRRLVKEQESKTPEAIMPEATTNVELVDQYVADSKRLAEVGSIAEKTRQALEEVESEYKTSIKRVDAVGLNETLGLMFRRSKSTLANRRRNFQPDGTLQAEIRKLQIELFRLEDLSKSASETESSINQLLEANAVPDSQRKPLKGDVVKLLSQRREILGQLTSTKTELSKKLVDLDVDKRKAIKEIDAYTNYINEHVLWIRSGAMVGRDDVKSFSKALQWVGLPSNWVALGETLVQSIQKKLGLSLFLCSSILLLFLGQRRLRKAIEAVGKKAETASCRTFMPTAISFVNTLLIAALWPGILLSLGWLILNGSSLPFVQAAAKSLILVAITIYPFEVLKQACRTHGLAQSHFGWSESSQSFVRANLRLVVITMPFLLLLLNLLEIQPVEEFRSSLGRATMVVLLAVMFIFVVRMFHPESKLYRGVSVSNQDDYWYRFRIARFLLVLLVFGGLLAFTLGGYYYTTFQLGSKLLKTTALLIGVVLAYGISIRWLTVRRRRLKIELLAAKREEQKRREVSDSAVVEGVKADPSAEPGLDANEVSKQAQELLMVAIGIVSLWIGWSIWADVIPAVGILDRVNLWSVSIEGIATYVTLQDLLFFAFAVTGTVVAVKNIPGILELLLLKRLPLDAGARYAVATIARYVLSVLGMIVAFAFLKIQWSQFSWLIAAISLGLGFGLQEIVANFVSGIILLLERPVRIGDVVTIEGTTGIVTKIQMRATTVTNWDQQELVVPNKNLITNSIFNWTLSNVLTRITLEFGVAYGSDPEFVRKTILEVVNLNPTVIDQPAASVIFQTFGDSSLNFVVRCCISGPEKKLTTTHELQVAINKRLAEHKIEIPFPQRVMHSTSAKNLEPSSEKTSYSESSS